MEWCDPDLSVGGVTWTVVEDGLFLGFLIVSDRDRSFLRCKALKKKKNVKVREDKEEESYWVCRTLL